MGRHLSLSRQLVTMFGLRISLVSVLTIGITTYLALKMWNHYDRSTFAYHPALLTAAFAGGFPLAIHSKTIGSKSVVHAFFPRLLLLLRPMGCTSSTSSRRMGGG